MVGLLEMRRRRLQFVLIALVVTLISYLVLMINALGVGLNRLAGSALLEFDAPAIAYSDRAGLSVIRSEIGAETLAAIGATPGATATAPIGYVAANYRRSNGTVESAAFLGYDPGTIGDPRVTAGRALTAADARGLLADRSFLRAAGLEVGDEVPVTLRLETYNFVIAGEIDAGAFFFQPAVYVLRSTWQEMKYGAIAGSERPAASVVLVRGKDVTGRYAGYEVVTKAKAFASIEGVSGQQATVTSLRVFGYVIGALVTGVFFYVLTLQKGPQVAMLKAVGATTFYVYRQVLVQVAVVAGGGLLFAVPLAWATASVLQRLPTTVPLAFTNGTFITTSVGLMFVAVAGTVFSGRHLAKVDPITALGQVQ